MKSTSESNHEAAQTDLPFAARTDLTLFPFASSDIPGIALGLHSLKEIPELYTLRTLDSVSLPLSDKVGLKSDDVTTTLGLQVMSSRPRPERLRPVEMTVELQKLLVDPGYRLTSAEPSDIEKLLVGMPLRWRSQALEKYQDRFSTFGKIPVNFGSFITKDVHVTGSARPMGCPEPPPAGSEFVLAWKEGDLWNWELSPVLKEDADNSPFVRTAKYLNAIKRLADSPNAALRQLGKNLMAKLPVDFGAIFGPKDESLLHAFEAGT